MSSFFDDLDGLDFFNKNVDNQEEGLSEEDAGLADRLLTFRQFDVDPLSTAPRNFDPPPVPESNDPVSMITTEAHLVSQRKQNDLKDKLVVSEFRDRPKTDPIIVNIVATVDINVKVNLDKIAQRVRNAAYNPLRFKAVRIRLKEPATTGFIFHTGKILVVGARSEFDAKLATRRVARIVQKIGYEKALWRQFKMVNLVAKADVGFRVNLEGLALEHSRFASYEPELFPGCVYKMLEPKATLLIFHSGKVMVISKEKKSLFDSFKKLYPALVGFSLRSIVVEK